MYTKKVKNLISEPEDLGEPEYVYELPQDKIEPGNASLLRRTGAFIIDLFVYNVIFYPLFLKTFQATSNLRTELLNPDYVLLHPELMNMMLGILAAASVIFGFYMALCEYSFGETVGKHLMNLKIQGKKNLWIYVTRNLLKSTFIILLPIDLLGVIFFNQRLIDKLLDVKVLYEKKIGLIEGLI